MTDYIKTDAEGAATITLSRAATIAGVPCGHIKMREPTAGDMLTASKANGNDAEREVALIANLCEVAPADIHALPLRDYSRLQRAFMGFTS